MAKFLRYLRITFSGTCLMVAVLLCALWVRSYWWFDFTTFAPRHSVASWRGRVYFDESMPAIAISGFDAISVRHRLPYFDVHSEWLAAKAIYLSAPSPPHHWKILPYPLIVVLVAAIAVAPWLRWRFSLRTLLIATTLVAVVLGLIVCLR